MWPRLPASTERGEQASKGGDGKDAPPWQVRLSVRSAEEGPLGVDAAPGRVRSARFESPAGAINTGRNPPEAPPPHSLSLRFMDQ